MDCRRFHHHYHYYKSHAWCDWSLEVVGFRAELTFGAFTYVKVCIFGNFLCACEKSQGWQFFVFIVKFAIFCKPGEFLNSLQFFAIFPLLYKIYENCEKSQGWWFFAIICDFCSSLLCCSSSWKPDMDFTNFAKNLKVNDFLTCQISISSCKFYNSCSYVQTWTCLPSVGVKTRLEIAWWVSTNAWYTFC